MTATPADLIVVNGDVNTLSAAGPDTAEALAVRDGIFVAVGSDADVLGWKGPSTTVVDAQGRCIIPGLIDAHTHLVRAGFTWNQELRWTSVTSIAEGLELISSQASQTPPGTWITVLGGWHPLQFAERRSPTIDELDAAAPDHPVVVQYLYEWALLNARARQQVEASGALGAGGFDPATVDVDESGRMAGNVRTMASLRWLYAQLPVPTHAEQVASTVAASRALAAMGITGVIDGGGANTGPGVYGPLREVWEAGDLPIRVRLTRHASAPGREEEEFPAYFAEDVSDDDDMLRRLGVGEVTLYSVHDGFNRLPDLSEPQVERLSELMHACAAAGSTVQIHLIRPETTDRVIEIWEDVNRKTPIVDLRWAIVHGHSVSVERAARLRDLGAGVIVEALLRLEGDEVLMHWDAQRLATAPPVAALKAAGTRLAAGSDAFRVASPNPFATLEWLCTGQTLAGTQIWDPSNTLDRRQALECMTTEAAWFSFEESSRGRIEEGYSADFAALTADYFTVPAHEIHSIGAEMTVVGGKVVWSTDRFAVTEENA